MSIVSENAPVRIPVATLKSQREMMSYKKRFNADMGLVEVVVEGSLCAIDIIDLYSDVTAYAETKGAYRILIDFRSTRPVYENIEILRVSEVISPLLLNCKVARVTVDDDYRQGLIQSVYEKKRIAMRNFNTVDGAAQWLLG